ncbi:MAG: hypothetical protein AAFV80_02340 [Bacteroidota bacterium]
MRVLPFELSVLGVVIRFFVGLFLGIIGGVMGNLWVMLLVIPIVLSAMLGLKFEFGAPKAATKRTLKPQSVIRQAS